MLWGENTQNILKSKKILIVGSGGLGCSVALALSGSGIGTIDIVDFDKIELHNIHRQVLFSVEDEGEYKAKVASNKICQRNPYLESSYYTIKFNEVIKETKSYDLIIDATDNLDVRKEIDKFTKSKNIPWIYGSVEEFNGQVCFFKDASFDIFATKKVESKGQVAPMVMQIASFEANLALRYLANIKVSPFKKTYLPVKLFYTPINPRNIFRFSKFVYLFSNI